MEGAHVTISKHITNVKEPMLRGADVKTQPDQRTLVERTAVKCSSHWCPDHLKKKDHLLSEWGEKMCIHMQKLEARSLHYIIHKSYKAQNDKNPRKH